VIRAGRLVGFGNHRVPGSVASALAVLPAGDPGCLLFRTSPPDPGLGPVTAPSVVKPSGGRLPHWG
jgi:hypothetical protein